MINKLEKPPNWNQIVEKFGVSWGRIVVSYSPAVYSAKMLTEDLIAHESVHLKQQGEKPDEWWSRYLNDETFRLSQEIEAYAAQFKFFKNKSKDRNYLFRIRHKLALDLSGSMYGHCIDFQEAFSKIG